MIVTPKYAVTALSRQVLFGGSTFGVLVWRLRPVRSTSTSAYCNIDSAILSWRQSRSLCSTQSIDTLQ